jgi:hypothetical protein
VPYVAIVYVNDPAIARALKDEDVVNRDVGIGRVVGLYRFPSSKDVECPGWRCPEVTNKRYGYAHHLTRGYIVHGACQRRERGWRARLAASLMGLLGYNLLPRDETPRVFQNPAGHEPR